uniref:Protein CASC3 n=1 Tax=Onchocerca volvulus TaxID=6282 RepID=A0A8R1XX21_ONCVO
MIIKTTFYILVPEEFPMKQRLMQSSFKMEKKKKIEVRVTMKESLEVLGITGTISEIKINDSEQSRKLEDEEPVNVHENENLENSVSNENANIQQLGSPDNDEEVSGFDQDQNEAHPAYIPRVGQFFMHDTRETGEKIKQYRLSRADYKWRHDLYNETDQIPMSDLEFAMKYGIDREGNPVSSLLYLLLIFLLGHIFILKLLQKLFPASQQDTRGINQIRAPAVPANIWNRLCHFKKTRRIHGHKTNYQDRRKDIRKAESENRLLSVGDALNKEYRENKKLDGGEEDRESRSEISNTDQNDTKLGMRLGKRYSTQRPTK